jgi:RNA-binding protein
MLTGKQRRFLRGKAHDLRPVVHTGKEGVSAAVIAAVDAALFDHELIKVKIGDGSEQDRHALAEKIALDTGSQLAQVLGFTIVLYRAHPDDSKIELPAA